MEYTICKEIEQGLFFTLNTVRSCGIGYNDTDFYWFQNYNGELIDTDLIEEKRKNWRERFLNHTEPEQCKNCHLLLTKDWKQDGKFNLIVIAHRSNCSCNCIYCNFSKDKNYWNNRESYNIVPVLEDLRDRNLLAENLMISICGGECTEYPNNEFENIMEFIIKQKCKLWINSSGFNYSPLISKCLSLSLLDITISVDAGTKEVYEKIKRVKKFDDVWNNIAEYQRNAVLDAGGYYGRMTVKFVIVPGINNTQKHFYDFIKKCREAKIKYIRIAVEYNWWTENKHKEMPKNLIKLVKYIQKFNQEFSIEPVEFAIRLFQIADSK